VLRRVALLMPAFEEGQRLEDTLRRVAATCGDRFVAKVFLVDDGSAQPLIPERLAPALGRKVDLVLLRHPVNLGQGAALETARLAALSDPEGFDAYVTMDGDGQHDPDDLPRFLESIEAGADVVFGNRFGTDSNVPGGRALLIACARAFERALTGLALSDAHNGYRAFNRKAIEHVLIEQDRMAHATEIKQRIAAVRPALIVREVSVHVRYTDETLAKGQSSWGALQILRDLLFGYVFRSNRR
jgi:polyprenyl-phospho-N-acetylgalactosaminyl synthase